jgi:hypothetical protein
MTTNEITIAKIQFAEALDAAGLRVSDFVPERIVPPILIIKAADPYLKPNSVGSEYIMGLELVLIASAATNAVMSEALDAFIQNTIHALPPYATMMSVGEPYLYESNAGIYLAANIRTDVRITI